RLRAGGQTFGSFGGTSGGLIEPPHPLSTAQSSMRAAAAESERSSARRTPSRRPNTSARTGRCLAPLRRSQTPCRCRSASTPANTGRATARQRRSGSWRSRRRYVAASATGCRARSCACLRRHGGADLVDLSVAIEQIVGVERNDLPVRRDEVDAGALHATDAE